MRKGIKKEMTDDIIIDCKNNALEQIKIVRHDLKQAHPLPMKQQHKTKINLKKSVCEKRRK